MRKEEKALLFEQYKMAVTSTERVSDARANANKFYLSVNSVIAGGILFYDQRVESLPVQTVIVATIFGLIICLTWFFALLDYKSLNSAKFKVIHDMEKELPVQFFKREWEILNTRKPWYQKYKYLSKVERMLPATFAVLYVTIGLSITVGG